MKQKIVESLREITHYLDEVLDLAPETRQAWLDALETREPAIAAQVHSCLLELVELEAEDFLGTNASSILDRETLEGQRFGAYTLDRAIGHGGMGTIWLAHRSDGRFDGQAAVKLLNAALVGHPSARRFAREGSVLAKLQHPNIAHLLDAGIAASSQPYLVLEYVGGDRIDRYCDSHKLSIERRIVLFLDVLAAVMHAHNHLIVHRDLKPSNILVTDDGVVKLLDFGVAALLSPDAESGTHLTRNIAAGLTPAYAAPEQFLGEPVTTATDVYALGLGDAARNYLLNQAFQQAGNQIVGNPTMTPRLRRSLSTSPFGRKSWCNRGPKSGQTCSILTAGWCPSSSADTRPRIGRVAGTASQNPAIS